jgi:transposase
MNLKELHLHWGESNYKGKKYRSYCLALPYRQNGRNRKKSVVKLGKLSDEEVKTWRTLLEAIKNPHAFLTTMDDISVTKHYKFLDVALANAIWEEWELDGVFPPKGKRDISIATVARILTLNRCIDPKAKINVPQWFRDTSLPWLLHVEPGQINSSRIFRELVFIEQQKQDICNYLFQRMKKDNPDSMKSVFYDLSSSCFSGTRCLLMKFGHCKEGFKNHVVLALVVNREGLPFYWEVLPGNTADVNTIEWLLERIKERFKVDGITLTFDRGMVSDDNLAALEAEDIKYISAMDKNQIEGITGLDFTQFSYLKPQLVENQAQPQLHEFSKINDNTYYREIKVEGKRRYILCFNPQLFKDQRKATSQAIENFHTFVNTLNEQLCKAKKSRNHKPTYAKFQRHLSKLKLKGFVDVTLEIKHLKVKFSDGTEHKIRTYQARVVLDKVEMLHAGRLDGFWLLVTNHKEKTKERFKVSAPEAIKPYRDKVVIESAFRDIKSFVEIEPIFVWTPLHVRAHYTICVLAYLINRTLTLRLHKHKGDTTNNIVAHEKLYKELSDCLIDHIEVENVQKSGCKMTRPNAKQEELLTRVGQKNLIL